MCQLHFAAPGSVAEARGSHRDTTQHGPRPACLPPEDGRADDAVAMASRCQDHPDLSTYDATYVAPAEVLGATCVRSPPVRRPLSRWERDR
jgi:hypothetical protein